MRNLLNFLWKNYAFFLFLFFESISLSMLFSSGHQSAIFSYTSNQMAGKFYQTYDDIWQYFHLTQTNSDLMAENIRLRTQLEETKMIRDTTIFNEITILSDTFKLKNDTLIKDSIVFYRDTTKPNFEYISAKVISNSIRKPKNYLMLNKGKNQGIKKNMGVVGPYGGVGIVYAVSDDFCTVISFLNTQSLISAKIQRNNELGSLQWDGKNPSIAHLKSIETYIPIQIGETVVSSGFSHIFPEGILLGTIKDFHMVDGSNTYNIDIQLSTKFSKLKYVSIIRNRFYEEQIELERRNLHDN
ncbi:MAG: rod shape-determining protein MreC [Bacteroidetes bacterium 4572_77]|nr:MAG: rod shape-determining protein MreC [Bacteroidetes bacterium 4572_77]